MLVGQNAMLQLQQQHQRGEQFTALAFIIQFKIKQQTVTN
jgi:hypothetical protein